MNIGCLQYRGATLPVAAAAMAALYGRRYDEVAVDEVERLMI